MQEPCAMSLIILDGHLYVEKVEGKLKDVVYEEGE